MRAKFLDPIEGSRKFEMGSAASKLPVCQRTTALPLRMPAKSAGITRRVAKARAMVTTAGTIESQVADTVSGIVASLPQSRGASVAHPG